MIGSIGGAYQSGRRSSPAPPVARHGGAEQHVRRHAGQEAHRARLRRIEVAQERDQLHRRGDVGIVLVPIAVIGVEPRSTRWISTTQSNQPGIVVLTGGCRHRQRVVRCAEMRIVGVGASTQSFEALRAFFRNLPSDTGVSYVVIAEGDGSALEALRGETALPVSAVQDGDAPRADRIDVVPADREVVIAESALRFVAVDSASTAGRPIPPLARVGRGQGRDRRHPRRRRRRRSVGVKLVQGIQGGLSPRGPDHARFAGCRRARSAPARRAGRAGRRAAARTSLRSWGRARAPRRRRAASRDGCADESSTLVRVRTGHDFSYYKRATLFRRIARRCRSASARRSALPLPARAPRRARRSCCATS